MTAGTTAPINILTIDVEDWCQTSSDLLPQPHGAMERPIPPSERVLATSRRLLRLLARHDVKATCFVLASVAETYPQLVQEMHGAGHEIASHGYGHEPVYRLDRRRFEADLERSLTILEGITGEPVLGYRAPYFSITQSARWALEILAAAGLRYDSSTFPIHRSLYGFYPGWDGGTTRRLPHKLLLPGGRSLIELPASTVRLGGVNLPAAGGALLRFMSQGLLHAAIRHLNRQGAPAVFYLHPHDLDAAELGTPQPGESRRQRALRWLLNVNRASNERKLDRLLRQFRFTTITGWLADPHSQLSETRGGGSGSPG